MLGAPSPRTRGNGGSVCLGPIPRVPLRIVERRSPSMDSVSISLGPDYA
jgi:hypothetical protein